MIEFQHIADIAKIIHNPSQNCEEKNNVIFLLKSVIKSFKNCKISIYNKEVRAVAHTPEQVLKESFEYIYLPVSKLGCKKTNNFLVEVVAVSVDKLDGVVLYQLRQTIFLTIVNIF